MSAQELNRVHRRYIALSNAFKSAWTFHQFLQALRKVFTEESPEEYQADFQSIYGQLKEVSQNLSEQSLDDMSRRLDWVEKRLKEQTAHLLQADHRVSPTQLRQFFQRVKKFDDNILSQLVRFYLYTHQGETWEADRLDKVDFISTKLCEEYLDERDVYVSRDFSDLRTVAKGFWSALGSDDLSDEQVAEMEHEMGTLRKEVADVESIDDVYQKRIVQRYREFKHQLHNRFFHPEVFRVIIDTNLALKNGIHDLYRREEQRIIAEYQQVFELEREVPVDVDLAEELADFRQAVERFEKQLQRNNVRLEEIGALRERGVI